MDIPIYIHPYLRAYFLFLRFFKTKPNIEPVRDFLLDSTSLNRSMGRAKAQQVWVVVRFWKKKI
jgi:hypothetical protein